ncbi:MAG TPA: hypothetical protein VK324_08830 [Tepidisphaeraceae bacterium]|nr:hypothetical protein [Tepidisphaeraceae bacterium]
MPSMLRRRSSRSSRSSSRPSANRPPATVPIAVTAAFVNGSVLTVTFDQPIVLGGVPRYAMTGSAAVAVSAAQTGPATIEVTYGQPVAGLTRFTVPYEEPAVRNASGGFVSTSAFDLL